MPSEITVLLVVATLFISVVAALDFARRPDQIGS